MDRRTAWIASGLAVGLLSGWWVAGRSGGRDLSQTELDAARDLWRQRGPGSYVLVIETRGAAGQRSVVEVQDGEVVSMETGGRPASRGAWRYWSVEGLFDFLESELENAAAARETYDAEPEEVVLKASFDGELGYPRRFLRHVMGTRNSIEWEIESLTAQEEPTQ